MSRLQDGPGCDLSHIWTVVGHQTRTWGTSEPHVAGLQWFQQQGQFRRDSDAALYSHDAASARCGHGVGDHGVRDMPAARLVAGDGYD